jgi:hypothetical protein
MAALALAGGSLTFLAFVLTFLVGAIFALYTRRGSGIDHHPYANVWGGAPAANLPCEDYSGSERSSVTEVNGVKAWRRRRRAQDPATVAAWIEEARARRRQLSAARTRNSTPIPSPLQRLP